MCFLSHRNVGDASDTKYTKYRADREVRRGVRAKKSNNRLVGPCHHEPSPPGGTNHTATSAVQPCACKARPQGVVVVVGMRTKARESALVSRDSLVLSAMRKKVMMTTGEGDEHVHPTFHSKAGQGMPF